MLCCFGLKMQIIHVSKQYFSYQTMTKISMSFPVQLPPPALSVCFRFGDIADLDLVDKICPINRSWSPGQIHRKIFEKLTLRQIFDVVPESSNAIGYCNIRFPGRYVMKGYRKAYCYKFFNVTRYYMQEYMCYRVIMNINDTYNFESVSQAESARGKIYNILFRLADFGRTESMSVIIHRKKVPTNSRYYSPIIRRAFTKNSSYSPYVKFHFTYSMTDIEKLPSPYDTKCGTIDGLTMRDCKKKCLIDGTLATFNKLPFNWIIEHQDPTIDINKHLIRKEDFMNATVDRTFDELELSCRVKCNIAHCHLTSYNTQLLSTDQEEDEDYMSFAVYLPQQQNILVKHVPLMEINEYLIYIMSCLGTWLGLSVMDVNPSRLFDINKKGNCCRMNATVRFLFKQHMFECKKLKDACNELQKEVEQLKLSSKPTLWYMSR